MRQATISSHTYMYSEIFGTFMYHLVSKFSLSGIYYASNTRGNHTVCLYDAGVASRGTGRKMHITLRDSMVLMAWPGIGQLGV